MKARIKPLQKVTSSEALAHAERWGIFMGLWVPSFFALSTRIDRYADKLD